MADDLGPPSRPDPRRLRPATGYTYLLPGGWLDIDVDPRRRAGDVRRVVRQRVRREPRLAPLLGQLDRWLMAECSAAWAAGADRVSLLAEPVGEHVATAALTMAVQSWTAALALTGPADPADLADPADPADLADPADPADPGRPEDLADAIVERLRSAPGAVERVELSQVQGVRRTWDDLQPIAADRSLPVRHWQVLVPCPGRPAVGVLALSCACPPLWPLMAATVEAVVDTFVWTWEQPAGAGPVEQDRPP